MTGVPKYTKVHCSVCGRVMGKRPGVQVVLGLICDDPICNFQEPAQINAARDAQIVAGYLAGISVIQIARSTGMSRQRVYQIIESWKAGV